MRRGRKRNANRKSPDELRTFGRLLKAARERSSRTQRDLAGELGINIITLSKYETGLSPVPDERAQQLARVLKAPELLSTLGRAVSTNESDAPAAASGSARGGDLLTSRPVLSAWWLERQSKLFHKDKVGLARIDELRGDIVLRVTDELRKEKLPVDGQTDDVLQEALERVLGAMLENRRLFRRPVTTAA